MIEHELIETTSVRAEHWPTYRVRLDVRARRVGHPFTFDHRLYPDGYIVHDQGGRVRVVSVAEFEALYELAGLTG
jgi:hypothetical protein